MKIFFGAAIQAHTSWGERSNVYEEILTTLKRLGHSTYSEHTSGKNLEDILAKMAGAIGPLPKNEKERFIFTRNKLIEGVEGNIDAAIFEVSTPSLGTGIEFTHAYLRPRLGLKEIPMLALYQKNFWKNHLSTMIRGICPETAPQLQVVEYEKVEDLKGVLKNFLKEIE